MGREESPWVALKLTRWAAHGLCAHGRVRAKEIVGKGLVLLQGRGVRRGDNRVAPSPQARVEVIWVILNQQGPTDGRVRVHARVIFQAGKKMKMIRRVKWSKAGGGKREGETSSEIPPPLTQFKS